MEFFNRKEEVIDIELTSHGKQLLSAGQFKPVYYAFYDDDITYDPKYGAASPENQKDNHDRIIQTPRVKPNTVFNSVESPFASSNLDEALQLFAPGPESQQYRDYILSKVGNIDLQSLEEYIIFSNQGASNRSLFYGINKLSPEKKDEYILPLPLGSSAMGTKKAPAWQIDFLKSELSSSQSTYVDGNRAYGYLRFDLTPNGTSISSGTAFSLNGETITLIDLTGVPTTFTLNSTVDPSHAGCTGNPTLICLDVNDDNSFSTTSNQAAQQVADKINAHPILITATVPSNDGEIALRQDASGDKGNSPITISDGAPDGLTIFSAENFRQGTDPTFAPLRIPQLYVDVFYDTSVGQEPKGINPMQVDPHSEVTYYEDGTFLKIDKDYILLEILEKNTPYEKLNFDLEVYSMPEFYDKISDPFDWTESDELQKLKLLKPDRYVNFSSFLYDSAMKKSFVPTTEFAEYYFDITVDDEIQDDLAIINKIQSILPTNDKELCEDE